MNENDSERDCTDDSEKAQTAIKIDQQFRRALKAEPSVCLSEQQLGHLLYFTYHEISYYLEDRCESIFEEMSCEEFEAVATLLHGLARKLYPDK